MIRIILFLLYFLFTELSQDSDSLTIVYTNNNNGNLVECDCENRPWGGLARRKTVIDGIRQENPNTFLFDSGDFLYQFGDLEDQDKMVIRLYEKTAYDAITLGDNDVVNGSMFLNKYVLKSNLPLVSTTLADKTGMLLLPPYMIKEKAGKRFAIIGYTPSSSFRFFPEGKENPVSVKNEKSNLKKTLQDVKSKADYIILLSHSGDDVDVELAKAFPEIDLIVGGHNQVETAEPIQVGKTLIVQAGGNGHMVGKMKVLLTKNKLTLVSNSLISLGPDVNKEPLFKSLIETLKKPSEH